MAKRPRKITYKEALVLANQDGKLTHAFLSENGFVVQEPGRFAPDALNIVQFTDKSGAPIAFHEITSFMNKVKPRTNPTALNDQYVYYFKLRTPDGTQERKSEFKLYRFKLKDVGKDSNVEINDVTSQYLRNTKSMYYHKAKDRNYVSRVRVLVTEKPNEVNRRQTPQSVKDLMTKNLEDTEPVVSDPQTALDQLFQDANEIIRQMVLVPVTPSPPMELGKRQQSPSTGMTNVLIPKNVA